MNANLKDCQNNTPTESNEKQITILWIEDDPAELAVRIKSILTNSYVERTLRQREENKND